MYSTAVSFQRKESSNRNQQFFTALLPKKAQFLTFLWVSITFSPLKQCCDQKSASQEEIPSGDSTWLLKTATEIAHFPIQNGNFPQLCKRFLDGNLCANPKPQAMSKFDKFMIYPRMELFLSHTVSDKLKLLEINSFVPQYPIVQIDHLSVGKINTCI